MFSGIFCPDTLGSSNSGTTPYQLLPLLAWRVAWPKNTHYGIGYIRKVSYFLSTGITLLCRTEVADRIGDLFFLVPDRTVKYQVPILDPEPSREGHADRMAGQIKDKHQECCHQEVKETLVGCVELGDII